MAKSFRVKTNKLIETRKAFYVSAAQTEGVVNIEIEGGREFYRHFSIKLPGNNYYTMVPKRKVFFTMDEATTAVIITLRLKKRALLNQIKRIEDLIEKHEAGIQYNSEMNVY